MRRPMLAIACVAAPLALWALLPLTSSGQSGTLATLQQKLADARGKVDAKKARERVLSGDIQGVTRRINVLQGDITELQRRQVRIQASLDRRRAQLARTQSALRAERARLVRLRARLAQAREILSERLVALYKADDPDLLSVVLDAEGFADLLERGTFMRRIGIQDKRIITRVREARAEATSTAKRLETLERRQQRIAATILAQRNQVAAIKGELVERRSGYAQARDRKQALLARTRASRQELEDHVHALERESAQIQARLQQGSGIVGPVRRGTGRFIWPVNGPVTSPFGQRWGRLHAGIDISAPGGTPIRAADSGTVVLMGWTGGYGNYTCIGHGGSISTCYAHQSGYATSQGASVSQGQVIGYVGNTGHSFGDHLHFEVRINGSPTDPMGYL